MENITQGPNRALKDKLAGFKDLVAQDSTIIRLHEKLAKRWPATRSRKVAVGVKVSLIISAVADGAKSVTLYGGRTNAEDAQDKPVDQRSYTAHGSRFL